MSANYNFLAWLGSDLMTTSAANICFLWDSAGGVMYQFNGFGGAVGVYLSDET